VVKAFQRLSGLVIMWSAWKLCFATVFMPLTASPNCKLDPEAALKLPPPAADKPFSTYWKMPLRIAAPCILPICSTKLTALVLTSKSESRVTLPKGLSVTVLYAMTGSAAARAEPSTHSS